MQKDNQYECIKMVVSVSVKKTTVKNIRNKSESVPL
jgi:hypothetical protein